LEDTSEINGDNLDNVRCDANRYFKSKRKYLKDKINDLTTNSKNKNIRDLYRGINPFKRVYQPRNNYIKMIMVICLHNVSDVRQIEVHTAELLVPGPIRLEVEIVIAKLKKYKSPGSHQILAELIQAGGEILLSDIHKLITRKTRWD
jgi:hypothetical protein